MLELSREVSTKPIHDCGQLPLVLGDISAAEIGSVLVDSESYSEIRDPDSYQETGSFHSIKN